MISPTPKLLSIAGSDSSAGAGIQGDIKTAQYFGVYASTAITALTSQNTYGISSVFNLPSEFIISQISDVLYDIGADIIKTGMLCNAQIITALCNFLEEKYPNIPLVVDPVMISSSGTKLLADDAISVMKNRLFKQAHVITPNIPEAQYLSGIEINNLDDMQKAAEILYNLGGNNFHVIITGGHLKTDDIFNVIHSQETSKIHKHERLHKSNTHGTGCSFASAVACKIALGESVEEASISAQNFILNAIKNDIKIGSGSGCLNHFHPSLNNN